MSGLEFNPPNLDAQRIITGTSICSDHLRNPRTKVAILANLLNDGLISDTDITEAKKTVVAMQKRAEEQARKRQAQAEETRKLYEMPDAKIPVLWRTKDTQPERLTKYLQTYDLNALQTYLTDLRERPLHYISLFPHGEMANVITFIENQLAKRTDSQASANELLFQLGKANAKDVAKLKKKVEGDPTKANAYTA